MKNTNYTIIFMNLQSGVSDLTILKPEIYVTFGNCTDIQSQYYDLKLGPISNTTINTTVKGTWLSPNIDTWIIYYNSNDSGCGGALNLIKVGTPTQTAPYVSLNEGPGFESAIVIFSICGLVFLRIRNKKH